MSSNKTQKEAKIIPGFSAYIIHPTTKAIQNIETGSIIKAFKRGGVFKLNLVDDTGKRKLVLQSRMLALTFLPNPKKLPCVLHSDSDQLNNSLDNLCWGSHRAVIINTVRNKNNA